MWRNASFLLIGFVATCEVATGRETQRKACEKAVPGLAADARYDWPAAMREVARRFKGRKGTFAHFGDSITVSRAFWYPLKYKGKNTPPEMERAFGTVNSYMLDECWDWKGPRYGNQGGMTIRWADRNVDTWLRTLNPEVALIMFGTNDLDSLVAEEYEARTRRVVQKCLANGTVVILSTIPPRHRFERKSRQFADIVRRIASELKVPLVDYYVEIMRRRPNDWDGASEKFKQYKGYDVPTLIARDGVHPSHPHEYRGDYSEQALHCCGFSLRNYLVLLKYAEVIERVLKEGG